MPKAAAMWPGPVSLLTTSLAVFNKAISSAMFVWPARFVSGTVVLFFKVSIASFSEAVPVATIDEPNFDEIFSAKAANRSRSQHLSP